MILIKAFFFKYVMLQSFDIPKLLPIRNDQEEFKKKSMKTYESLENSEKQNPWRNSWRTLALFGEIFRVIFVKSFKLSQEENLEVSVEESPRGILREILGAFPEAMPEKSTAKKSLKISLISPKQIRVWNNFFLILGEIKLWDASKKKYLG